MLVVRDLRNELAALRERELELQARHAEQLVRVLQQTGADTLDPTLLAGILLAGVEEEDPKRIEAWRARGEAMFRPARPRRRKPATGATQAAGTAGAAAASAAGDQAA